MSRRPIRDIISRRIQRERVTVIRWPSIPGTDAQIEAYKYFLHTYRSDCEWAAILDIDEFINLKKDIDIHSFLSRFPTASSVALNWKMFGSSGEKNYRKSPLIERFTRAAELDFPANALTKTIYRLSRVESIQHHSGSYLSDEEIVSPDGRAITNSPFSPAVKEAFAVAQVNHYFTKSAEEWTQKNLRGYADPTKRTEADFHNNDRNEEEDLTILVRMKAMDRLMPKVASRALFIPRPYTALNQILRAVRKAMVRLRS